MKKIGLCGVHGSGKTTKTEELRKQFADAGKTVFVSNEIARSCPHPLGSVATQEWIWARQLSQEMYAASLDVDVVICDRTVMDNLMYYRDILTSDHVVASDRWCRWWDLYQEAVEFMPTYDRVIRLPLNLKWLQADDPIRPKDIVYARRIDALFDRFVQPHLPNDRFIYHTNTV